MRKNEIILTDAFASTEGQIERPIKAVGWCRPSRVELQDGKTLRFVFDGPLVSLRPTDGLVNRFLRLRNATAQEILRLAQRWGALYTHPEESGSASPFDSLLAPVEPVSTWRALSGIAYELFEKESRLKDAEDRGTGKPVSSKTRREIARRVNIYFGTGEPQLGWDANLGSYSIIFVANCVRDAIGLQLMAMLAGSNGFALCPACGKFFTASGKRVYCERCGPKEANRLSQRRRYARIKAAQKLSRLGKPPGEIAAEFEPLSSDSAGVD